MAGTLKPNMSNLGKEAIYQRLSGLTHGSDGRGLFDGVSADNYTGHQVAYWVAVGDYVEIEITSKLVNIWRIVSYQGGRPIASLKVEKKVDGVYQDITSSIQQKQTDVLNTWQIYIEHLQKGVYKFSYNNSGRLDTEWFIETVSTDKILLLNSNAYKKWDGAWQTVSLSSPTEQEYTENGMNLESISTIPESAWQQLNGTVELCYYTDDSSKTEAQFNVETTPFTLADEFKGKEVKILEYTDNPSQIESKVETEVEPYSIYDEFGDTMEVLYYTDDTAKTKADLEITANYSPLDEVEGDFEVVTWSNAIDEVVQEAIPQLTSDVVAEGTVYETPLNLENVVKVK